MSKSLKNKVKLNDAVSVKDFGAVGDGTDETTKVQAAIDWANASPTTRELLVPGQFYCASDLTNLHSVRMTGPGSIRIGTGAAWFVEPDRLNTGFVPLTAITLYVSPAGSDSASGLAPEFAFATIQAAADALSKKRIYGGRVRIQLEEGVYTSGLNTAFLDLLQGGTPLEILGPTVSAWNNTTPPTDPVSITGITSANPPVVTANSHGRSNGDKVFIGLAQRSGGMHASDGAIYTVANVAPNTFELQGVNGTGWAAYTSGGKVYALVGAAPKAIFYGTGNGSGIGFNLQRYERINVNDVAFIAWGSKAGTADEGGLIARTFANVITSNVHCFDCTQGIVIRDESTGIVLGGWAHNCATGFKAIHSRFTLGASNPGSTLTTTPIVQVCSVGADVWEMASGHADGNIFKDCPIEAWVRKNSQAVLAYNQFINTGSVKAGVTVQQGCYANVDTDNSSNVWTGLYRPRVRRRGNTTLESNGNVLSWLTHQRGNLTSPTPGAGEATIMTLPISQGQMTEVGQGIRVKASIGGTWANGNVVLRLKLGATTLATLTSASNVAGRNLKAEFELTQNGFNFVRMDVLSYDTISGTTTPRYAYAGAAFDVSAANQTFTVTAEIVSGLDSAFSFFYGELESIGW